MSSTQDKKEKRDKKQKLSSSASSTTTAVTVPTAPPTHIKAGKTTIYKLVDLATQPNLDPELAAHKVVLYAPEGSVATNTVSQHLPLCYRAKWDANKARFFFVNLMDKSKKSWKLPEIDRDTLTAIGGKAMRPPSEGEQSTATDALSPSASALGFSMMSDSHDGHISTSLLPKPTSSNDLEEQSSLTTGSVLDTPPSSSAVSRSASTVYGTSMFSVNSTKRRESISSRVSTVGAAAATPVRSLELHLVADAENKQRYSILQDELTRWASIRQYFDEMRTQTAIMNHVEALNSIDDQTTSAVAGALDEAAEVFAHELEARRYQQETFKKQRYNIEEQEMDRRVSMKENEIMAWDTVIQTVVTSVAKKLDAIVERGIDDELKAREKVLSEERITRLDLHTTHKALQRQRNRLSLQNIIISEQEVRQTISFEEVQARLAVNRRIHAMNESREEDLQRRVKEQQRLQRLFDDELVYERDCRVQIQRTEAAERAKVYVFEGKGRLEVTDVEEARRVRKDVNLRAALPLEDNASTAAEESSPPRSPSPNITTSQLLGSDDIIVNKTAPTPTHGHQQQFKAVESQLSMIHQQTMMRALVDECFFKYHELFSEFVVGLRQLYQNFVKVSSGVKKREITLQDAQQRVGATHVADETGKPTALLRNQVERDLVEKMKRVEAQEKQSSFVSEMSRERRAKEWRKAAADLDTYGGTAPFNLQWSPETLQRTSRHQPEEGSLGILEDQSLILTPEGQRHQQHIVSKIAMNRYMLRCSASLWQPMPTAEIPLDLKYVTDPLNPGSASPPPADGMADLVKHHRNELIQAAEEDVALLEEQAVLELAKKAQEEQAQRQQAQQQALQDEQQRARQEESNLTIGGLSPVAAASPPQASHVSRAQAPPAGPRLLFDAPPAVIAASAAAKKNPQRSPDPVQPSAHAVGESLRMSKAPMSRTLKALGATISGPDEDLFWDECGSKGVSLAGGSMTATAVVTPGIPILGGHGLLHDSYVMGTLGIAKGQFAWEVSIRNAPVSTQSAAARRAMETLTPSKKFVGPTAPLFIGMASRHFKGRDSRCPAYMLRNDGAISCNADGTDGTAFAQPFYDGSRVTIYLDMNNRQLSFYVDGKDQGVAFRFAQCAKPEPLFPVVMFAVESQSVSLKAPSVESLKQLIASTASKR